MIFRKKEKRNVMVSIITVLLLSTISLNVVTAADNYSNINSDNINAIMLSNYNAKEYISEKNSSNESVYMTVIDDVNNIDNTLVSKNTELIIDMNSYENKSQLEKNEIDNIAKTEFENNKNIIYYGDNTNLDLENLSNSLDCELAYEVSYDGSTKEKIKDIKSISFEKLDDGSMSTTLLVDETNNSNSFNSNISDVINASKNSKSNNNSSTLQNKQCSVYTGVNVENFKVIDKHDCLTLTNSYSLKRVSNQKSFTVWDVYFQTVLSPTKGFKANKVSLQSYRPDKGENSSYNEYSIDFSPEEANDISSYTVSVNGSLGTSTSVGASTSYTQNLKDVDLYVTTQDFKQFYQWDYYYNKPTTDGITKQSCLTRWANKGGAMNISLNSWARVKNGWNWSADSGWFMRFKLKDIK